MCVCLHQALLAALLLGALKAEDGACTNGMCADVPFAQPPVELSIIQPRHGEIVRKHEAGLSIAFQGRPMPARSHTPRAGIPGEPHDACFLCECPPTAEIHVPRPTSSRPGTSPAHTAVLGLDPEEDPQAVIQVMASAVCILCT